MEAYSKDVRDQAWEVHNPTYRVIFWSPDGNESDEWELTGGDVRQVLAWADANRGKRSYVAYVCTTLHGSLGMIRLLGEEPSRSK